MTIDELKLHAAMISDVNAFTNDYFTWQFYAVCAFALLASFLAYRVGKRAFSRDKTSKVLHLFTVAFVSVLFIPFFPMKASNGHLASYDALQQRYPVGLTPYFEQPNAIVLSQLTDEINNEIAALEKLKSQLAALGIQDPDGQIALVLAKAN